MLLAIQLLSLLLIFELVFLSCCPEKEVETAQRRGGLRYRLSARIVAPFRFAERFVMGTRWCETSKQIDATRGRDILSWR